MSEEKTNSVPKVPETKETPPKPDLKQFEAESAVKRGSSSIMSSYDAGKKKIPAAFLMGAGLIALAVLSVFLLTIIIAKNETISLLERDVEDYKENIVSLKKKLSALEDDL